MCKEFFLRRDFSEWFVFSEAYAVRYYVEVVTPVDLNESAGVGAAWRRIGEGAE